MEREDWLVSSENMDLQTSIIYIETIVRRTMERSSREKVEAVIVAIFLVLILISVPVLYLVVDVPLILVAGVALIYVIVAALVIYYTRQRFREIEEGLEDAVDNY